jgi:cell division protein FtsB
MSPVLPPASGSGSARLAGIPRAWGTGLLLALLAWVQIDLWFGKGNWPEVMRMERALAAAQATLAESRERNARVSAEVSDLQEGLEMVEEKARSELGMLRAHEVFVQIGDGGAAAPAAADTGPGPAPAASR